MYEITIHDENGRSLAMLIQTEDTEQVASMYNAMKEDWAYHNRPGVALAVWECDFNTGGNWLCAWTACGSNHWLESKSIEANMALDDLLSV